MQGYVKDIYEKIKHFCAYQERSQYEVKKKLYSFGLSFGGVEALITRLIEENYLNEERFALSFVHGKFTLKKWGRIKIRHELLLKKVSECHIKTSLKEIEEQDYLQTLQYLAEKKWGSLANEQAFARQAKTTQYLLQKGYELALVQSAVREMDVKYN